MCTFSGGTEWRWDVDGHGRGNKSQNASFGKDVSVSLNDLSHDRHAYCFNNSVPPRRIERTRKDAALKKYLVVYLIILIKNKVLYN